MSLQLCYNIAMTLFFISLATVACTLFGGLFALRFRDKLHLILGFSAGAVIGVAFFDLLPEALELASGSYEADTVTLLVAAGFVVYMICDRFFFIHGHGSDDFLDEHCGNHHHQARHSSSRGILGAGSLSLHSFLDGLGVGLAFQVSTAVGMVVAIAVLVHDFSDGINTVGMIMKNGGDKSQAFRWLLVDALAPTLGIVASTLFVLSGAQLGLLLAVFCGFFLYIGASDLLPESHHSHPTFWTTFMTILGVAVLYLAILFAGI